jgi:membrane peptidoglycan carboxypeptidase
VWDEGEEARPSGLDVYRERLKAIEERGFFQSIHVEDRNGHLLATVAPDGRRTWVRLEAIPELLRNSVIATEDQTFYSNAGVDASAVARAAFQNAQAGETVSGASTITMQLVRLVAFDPAERYEQTFDRKLREAHLAAELNEAYSKDEILEAYMNVAYFGHQAYGVEAASNTYFGRTVSQLSAAQATLLAGLPQAPAKLDPHENFEGARARQRVVLDRLHTAGHLTKTQADAIWSEPIELVESPAEGRRARHFVDYVLAELPAMLGEEVAGRGGFTVTTTLDLELNERIEQIAQGPRREFAGTPRPYQCSGRRPQTRYRRDSGDGRWN